MTSFVALLRGINVGGNKAVGMAQLREMAEALGFTEARTLLQSGNLIFKAKGTAPKLETLLAKETEKTFGHAVDYFVRSAAEWEKVLAQNPFAREAKADPSHLLVMYLREEPSTGALDALKAAIKGREYFEARGRELYLVYPDGIGASKLTGAVIEAKLGTRGSARNWNTVGKIAAMLAV